MRSLIVALLCCLFLVPTCPGDLPADKIKQANDQIRELEKLVRGGKIEQQPQPKELQWNRYVTKNFEILSLDDAQGKYLGGNIEFMKTWILWRWGIKDIDFQAPCKVICVPSTELFEKLFNRKTPTWRADSVNGKVEGVIWIVTDQPKWNTSIPNQLTEVIIANFEAIHNTKLPVWCRRGMSVVNGRLTDIKSNVTLATKMDTKMLLEMTTDNYHKLTEPQRIAFDANAATFCLWARQEYSGKIFLNFLSGSMTNPQQSLQVFGLSGYVACDGRVQLYQQKLLTGSDYYLTW